MRATGSPEYVASLGPANLRLTGELADGWIGTAFFPEDDRYLVERDARLEQMRKAGFNRIAP